MTDGHQITKRLKLWQLAVLAFAAMCLQDILATIMVVQESHYEKFTAGIFDSLSWLFGFVCGALAIDSFIKGGWRTKRSMVIILAVSAANYLGTMVGVMIAQSYH